MWVVEILEGMEVGTAVALAVRVLLEDWAPALSTTGYKAALVCGRRDL